MDEQKSNIAIDKIILYKSGKKVEACNLKKDLVSNLKINPAPILLNINLDQCDTLASSAFSDALNLFKDKIVNNFNQQDLGYFHHNFGSLRILPKRINLKKPILFLSNGYYDTINNIIYISEKKYRCTIFHELFHMASTISKDGLDISGFCQMTDYNGQSICYGKSINEGYTEVLSHRYFKEVKEQYQSYDYEEQIAHQLEKIVGQKKMESIYMRGDLLGLIAELEKYAPREDIMKYILNTDRILEYRSTYFFKLIKPFSPEEHDEIEKTLKEITTFLLRTFIIKFKKMYLNNEIDNIELINQVQAYINSFRTNIKIGNNTFKTVDIMSIKEEINTILTDVPFSVKSF